MAAKNARTLDWKEQRRWRALDLKRDGWTHHEIAEALDVTKGAVSQWITRVAREGEEALRARPHLGATPKLTKDQLRMIPEFLSHGAEAYGFRGEVWTCARIHEVIRREFSVAYYKDHVSRLLKVRQWTPQKPAKCAAQRDEQKIVELERQSGAADSDDLLFAHCSTEGKFSRRYGAAERRYQQNLEAIARASAS